MCPEVIIVRSLNTNDEQGNAHTLNGRTSAGERNRYSIGDEITILYNPNTPSKARMKSRAGGWFRYFLFFGVGAAFSLAGGITIVKSR
jgi:hypothetical protein